MFSYPGFIRDNSSISDGLMVINTYKLLVLHLLGFLVATRRTSNFSVTITEAVQQVYMWAKLR